MLRCSEREGTEVRVGSLNVGERCILCAGDQVEGKQGHEHWRWIQTASLRCRWEAKWSRGNLGEVACKWCCGGGESVKQDHEFKAEMMLNVVSVNAHSRKGKRNC